MNKKTKIIIATAAFALVFAGAGVYIATESNWFSPPIGEPMPHDDSVSSSSSMAVASSASSEEKYVVPPLPLPPTKDKTASSLPAEDKTVVTQNPDGTTNTEITRPDFSKPEPPPPPKMDESQASDPTKEPEYTEEQLKPNQPTTPDKPSGGGTGGGTTDKPTTPDKPTGGETNNKGQIYVPGFGWMENKPSTGSGEIAENAGTGEVIGY